MIKTKILTILLFSLLIFNTFVYGGDCSISGNIELCNNVTTYIDTSGNEFDIGTITFSDGINKITILDRNLGAKSNDISEENYYKQNCKCPIGFDFVKKTEDTYADSCDRKYCIDDNCSNINTWHIWVKDLCHN